MSSPGRFRAKSTHVERFRLLLTREMLPEKGPVHVRVGSRTTKKAAVPDKALLLTEFVERLDRSFLPVAEVTVP